MSSEEQDAALLRLVKDRSETRKKRTLLENELRTWGDGLNNLGTVLRMISPMPDNSYLLAQLEHNKTLLSPRLLDAVRDYLDMSVRLTDMDSRAKQLGID